MNNIVQNIQDIEAKIAAASFAGHEVNLVAVSKRQSIDKIREALAAGQRVFGENRVQEAQEHWGESGLRSANPDMRLHLIGPLQSNKAREAVALFDVIQTLDREKIARKLATEMAEQGKDLPCFIQVNTGEELQKSGISPEDLVHFYSVCTNECGLKIVGLMCIPPVDEPPALHFALLKKLADGLGLSQLSMGMSSDYERAVELGATHVRVGSGVFGARED